MQLMAEQGMLGEEDDGLGFGTKAAIGAGAGGLFVGASPFRREAMAQLMFGRDGATRSELMKALGAGFKAQGKAVADNPMALLFGADRKLKGREAVIENLPDSGKTSRKPLGQRTASLGTRLVPPSAGAGPPQNLPLQGPGVRTPVQGPLEQSKSLTPSQRRFQKVLNRGTLPPGALTSPHNRKLAQAATGGLMGRGATLGGRLMAGSGIASMLWLAYEMAKIGKKHAIDRPGDRREGELEMANNLLRGGPTLENSFAGQYLKAEGQLHSPDLSRPEDALIEELMGRHDMMKLRAQAKQKPPLSQGQAMNIIQAIGGH